MEKKQVRLNFPPDVVLKYIRGWNTEAKKQAKSEPDKAMADDIVTMVEVAASVMVQVKEDGK